ncbi:MAG: hypothetical protein OXC15_00540 [Rhodospirillaceae bacterium]|nr:hypothetical protein [Rhodospirillaceae bacterium]
MLADPGPVSRRGVRGGRRVQETVLKAGRNLSHLFGLARAETGDKGALQDGKAGAGA